MSSSRVVSKLMLNGCLKRVTRTVMFVIATALALPVWAAELPRERIDAWDQYVRLTERRIASELAARDRFLVLDFQEDDDAERERAALRAGEMVVASMKTLTADGEDVSIPGAMIHHWRGAILIPGATLDDVLEDVMYPDAAEYQQEDVLETRVLERGDDWLHLYLKLQRSKIVTATYNTEHEVRYTRHGPNRASSRTIATSIRELADAGTPQEREKAEGDDRGFLWRLNSYWRYEQTEDGVIVECESLTLSRSIPFLIAPIVRPIVSSIAEESMNRTLTGLRTRFTQKRL